METNFRQEEKCVCCGDSHCNTCDCDELKEEIEQEKKIWVNRQ